MMVAYGGADLRTGERNRTLETLETLAREMRAGRFAAARAGYEALLDDGFDSYALQSNLALCHKRMNDWPGAVEHFTAAFRLKRAIGVAPGGAPAPSVGARAQAPHFGAFQIGHLIDQLDYLKMVDDAPWFDAPSRDALENACRFLNDCYGPHGAGPLPLHLPETAKACLSDCPSYVFDLPRGPIVDPGARIVAHSLPDSGATFYVVDGILSPDALECLRRFLIRSTIWFDARPGRRYLGAHLHDGLANALVEATVSALREFLTPFAGATSVAQVWAFKYAAKSAGIDLHADQADWNINFWLADDRWNLDPETGGMTIYDCVAPAEWGFEQYNSRPDLARSLIKSARPSDQHVRHRTNRAVIFPSKLLHATDAVNFADDYEGRRMNMTVLFDKH